MKVVITDGLHQIWNSAGSCWQVHNPRLCHPGPCVFHNPSDHVLVKAPWIMRGAKGFMVERQCFHGLFHPDPDSLAFFLRQSSWLYQDFGRHRCDGCCKPT